MNSKSWINSKFANIPTNHQASFKKTNTKMSEKRVRSLGFYGAFSGNGQKQKCFLITTLEGLSADVLRLWELGIAFEPPRLVAWIPAITKRRGEG